MAEKNKQIVIGIPAWNEALNIKLLLTDLLNQRVNCGEVAKIVVVSDGSDDSTVLEVRSLDSHLVEVIDHSDRQGQGARQNELLERTDYDALVLINADIRVTDKLFVEKLCAPILLDGYDLTSCRLQEGKPKNFFEKVLGFGNEFKRRAFEKFNQGDNWHNCRGGARAFSAKLGENFRFGRSISEDLYSYLYTKINNYKFKYVYDTECIYALPSRLVDHIKQNKRFYGSASIFYSEFGKEFVDRNTKWPYFHMTIEMLKLLIVNPIIGLSYCFLSVYCMVYCRYVSETQVNNWTHVTSSKEVRI